VLKNVNLEKNIIYSFSVDLFTNDRTVTFIDPAPIPIIVRAKY
jgi:hypothetical protein